MTFLNTGLLWLLPLAAIPIVLHLLTLFRLRTIELSTFRFLFDSYLQQRRRMKFLEALLAALRTLFLVLLILVVARPMIRHWNDLFQVGGGGGREIVLLMDCSASMGAETAGEPALERAKRAAKAVVKYLAAEDRVTLIRVAARPEELFSRFSSDAASIYDKIDSLTVTPARANFYAAFTQVFGPEAPKRSNPAVYLFTDCQATGWNEVRNQGLERILPDKTHLVIVNVGSNELMPNQAVVGNPPPARRSVIGLPVRLSARVVNYSKDPAKIMLRALVDQKEIYRKELLVKPGETVTQKVPYTPTEPGIHRGSFEINSTSGDRFRPDDSYLFALPVLPRIRVLLVNGNPSVDPEADETLYVRALADIFADDAGEAKPGKKDNKAAGLAALRDLARSIDLREIREPGVTAEALRDAGVVLLANCGGLSDAQFVLLRQFVTEGGGLLIFPGDKVVPATYNTRFFPIPGVQGEFLTPVQLDAPVGDPDKLESFDQLAGLDFSHPVLSVFDEPERKVPYFKKVYFYRRFPIEVPNKEKVKFWPLAEFHSGKLALVENTYGDGLVIVAGFPVNRKWSNLPTENGNEFVPLILRLISHVQHRAELEARAAVAPGDVVEVSATGGWNPAVCKVTDPKGRTTLVSLERSGTRLVGAFERTEERGYYTIDARPEQAELVKGATLDFAVNLAPEESDFRTHDRQAFEKLLPGAKITFVDASAEAQQARSLTDDLEEPIWRPLIYLMFIIIGAEFLLATLGGRKKEVDEGPSGADERVHDASAGGWAGNLAGVARKEP
jgi:hypothetical protein